MFMHRPMEVENVEIERMRLHMERDGKGEMNCWAALGTVRKSTSEFEAKDARRAGLEQPRLEQDHHIDPDH